jgi:hypothetical protein
MAANKWAIMGGIALNVEYTRKYGFDATAAAKVTARLVAVPPPSAFQSAVQADLAGRAKQAADVLTATALTAVPAVILPDQLPPALHRDEEVRRPTPLVAGQPTPPAPDEEAVLEPFELLAEDKAGVAYTLDDGITAPRRGRVSADGVLADQIAPDAQRLLITFADESAPIEFSRRQPPLLLDEDEDEEAFDLEVAAYREQWRAVEDEEIEDDLDELSETDPTEDDERVLPLVFPEKAGKRYTLVDGVSPVVTGVVAEDGAVVHAISPQATAVQIYFEDEEEPIELAIVPAA